MGGIREARNEKTLSGDQSRDSPSAGHPSRSELPSASPWPSRPLNPAGVAKTCPDFLSREALLLKAAGTATSVEEELQS